MNVRLYVIGFSCRSEMYGVTKTKQRLFSNQFCKYITLSAFSRNRNNRVGGITLLYSLMCVVCVCRGRGCKDIDVCLVSTSELEILA